uniref:Uncharacterized protein n=1 Tax=Haptolina ericina TaxID=156174 RepID=A0A7S3AHE3_9EUKA|mmetsp:Transcript_1917/g.4301  ORF Transcript_1917/g.4301 Transcript_1917/m.4301 type:complete len:181 (+) Transcript_1917:190-732(+)
MRRLDSFMQENQLKLIIRGHQPCQNGFEWIDVDANTGRALLTVHTGRFDHTLKHHTAVLRVRAESVDVAYLHSVDPSWIPCVSPPTSEVVPAARQRSRPSPDNLPPRRLRYDDDEANGAPSGGTAAVVRRPLVPPSWTTVLFEAFCSLLLPFIFICVAVHISGKMPGKVGSDSSLHPLAN